MTILVVTRSDDNLSVARVLDGLRARGRQAFRLDTDDFPQQARLDVRIDASGCDTIYESGDQRIALSSVAAVWYRRNAVGKLLPDALPRRLRDVARAEAQVALLGAINGLPCFQMDSFWTVRRASQKPLQLRLARQHGLEIPRTVITNDAARVREFAAAVGSLVFKPVGDIATSSGEAGQRVWTNRLTPTELADLDGLDLSPMIFQEEVPKVAELRATIIGDEVFTARLDASEPGADQDWRRHGLTLAGRWQSATLPEEVAARLLALAAELGLSYGAADLLLTPDGRHVFLELNPCGELSWLDETTDLPLTDAIIDLLDRAVMAGRHPPPRLVACSGRAWTSAPEHE